MMTDPPVSATDTIRLTPQDQTPDTSAEAEPVEPATPATGGPRPRTRTRKPTLKPASHRQTPISATGAAVAEAEPSEQAAVAPSTPVATRTRTDEDPAPTTSAPAGLEPGAAGAASGSKLDRLLALLGQPGGATLAALSAATGWQAHSVRGALAGALRKKGYVITSETSNGVRRYRLGDPA